ncbi:MULTISPECIES: FtsX-like permease family protein [unclassified Roseateles]|uniref:FtsX-like permease family protein n=1 Tax=unclassified Roseateles TaxID=2626991 RepID=UPI0006F21285|nr:MULTISPECIES: FtsX-like permease family protein [unclassified Roseateles]KQW43602.1 multidrug ABC transporter substrate-binding protein [Pelomonas sp. Root405]KRA71340.1 multidrug ABC transporter substrate-binding protein [Pelomonas sp. Root662]
MIRLAWRYLWSSPLTTALNLLLLTLSLAAVTFVLRASAQVESGLRRDLAGIDLVVGAKGSPMQIMLAGVFHLDAPTGNIPLATLELLRQQPLVAQAVPLSLGDSYQGFRIAGTAPEYIDLYGGKLSQGVLWTKPMQAVLGAEVARATGLKPGDRFAGSHGLAEGGGAHGEQQFEVVGVLAESGSVLDRLVLADLASVWEVHEEHHADETHHDEDQHREITLALVRYRSPLAAVSLPRWVNAQDGLQSAAPALETARLMRLVGAGTEVLRGFGVVLLVAAGLSVWVALLHAVRARQGDLAMLRMLGAPARRVAVLIALEALLLAGLAAVLGLAAGHGLVAVLERVLAERQSLRLGPLGFSEAEWLVPLLACGLALLSAAWPAWRAYRLDVTTLLQAPR